MFHANHASNIKYNCCPACSLTSIKITHQLDLVVIYYMISILCYSYSILTKYWPVWPKINFMMPKIFNYLQNPFLNVASGSHLTTPSGKPFQNLSLIMNAFSHQDGIPFS